MFRSMGTVREAARLPPLTDLPKDRRGRPVPEHIGEALAILQIILTYARHLADTLEHRAVARGFFTIAQFFGTARLPVIRARLARGILRITALQNVLLARAARGRDLVFLQQRWRPPREQKKAPPAAEGEGRRPPRKPPVRRRDTDAPPDPDNLPTLAQLEAEARRHPFGHNMADICRDIAVAPGLCAGWMWNFAFFSIHWYRGNIASLMKDFHRREIAFVPEWDHSDTFEMPERSREGARRMLGFFIGEESVTPPWVPTPEQLVNPPAPPLVPEPARHSPSPWGLGPRSGPRVGGGGVHSSPEPTAPPGSSPQGEG